MKIQIKGVGDCLPDINTNTVSNVDRSIPAMVYQAVNNCLDDAKKNIQSVDAIVTASVDLWDGKTASNIAITEVVGAVMKSETRIAGDGLLALIHGAMTILSGQYDSVLVVAHGKSSETEVNAVSNWSFDPVYQQPLGLTNHHALGLQADSFLKRKNGSGFDNLDRANLVKSFYNNSAGISTKDVFASPLTFSPLHDLEFAPQGDGACAVLLQKVDGSGITLKGFGYDMDVHYLGDRDLSRGDNLKRAANRAIEMAKISDQNSQPDKYYWSVSSSLQLPIWAESLGLWSMNDRLGALMNKNSESIHDIQWAGQPPFAEGIQRLISAVKDLRNSKNPLSVMVHGCHGPAGQMQAVCILNNGDRY